MEDQSVHPPLGPPAVPPEPKPPGEPAEGRAWEFWATIGFSLTVAGAGFTTEVLALFVVAMIIVAWTGSSAALDNLESSVIPFPRIARYPRQAGALPTLLSEVLDAARVRERRPDFARRLLTFPRDPGDSSHDGPDCRPTNAYRSEKQRWAQQGSTRNGFAVAFDLTNRMEISRTDEMDSAPNLRSCTTEASPHLPLLLRPVPATDPPPPPRSARHPSTPALQRGPRLR